MAGLQQPPRHLEAHDTDADETNSLRHDFSRLPDCALSDRNVARSASGIHPFDPDRGLSSKLTIAERRT